jgi:uncharacterized protein YfcZ (UPF0381/DUF406 family)
MWIYIVQDEDCAGKVIGVFQTRYEAELAAAEFVNAAVKAWRIESAHPHEEYVACD